MSGQGEQTDHDARVGVETFGAALRRLRRAANLTQEELAERAGVSVYSISNFERGALRRPHQDTLRLLAEALILSADERAWLLSLGRQGNRPSLTGAEPSDAVASRAASQAPSALTPLIGREVDSARVCALLREPAARLLTLVGAPGVGKTRLATHLARELAPSFPDGVVVISLANLDDPSAILGEIAHALGVQEGKGRPLVDVVVAALETRKLLLVLDNFEHLLPGILNVRASHLTRLRYRKCQQTRCREAH